MLTSTPRLLRLLQSTHPEFVPALLGLYATVFLKSAAAAYLAHLASKRLSHRFEPRVVLKYVWAVLWLSPIDVLVPYLHRRFVSRYGLSLSRFVIEKNLAISTSKQESIENVLSEGGERFLDGFLDVSMELVGGFSHTITFGYVLHSYSPALFKSALMVALGTTISALTLASKNLSRLLEKERVAATELNTHLVRSKEHAESIQFLHGRDFEVAKAYELSELKNDAVLERKAFKDALKSTGQIVRSMAGASLPSLYSNEDHDDDDEHGHHHSHTHSHQELRSNPVHGGKNGALTPHTHSHGRRSEEDSSESLTKFIEATSAFDEILFHLSLVSENLHEIVKMETAADEVCALLDPSETAPTPAPAAVQLVNDRTMASEHWLSLLNISVRVPTTNATVVSELSFSLKPGETLLISGPSGCGKTALLRALCGVWTSGEGIVYRPTWSDCVCLPQRPYTTLGSLGEQITYPHPYHESSERKVRNALARVGLGHVVERGPTRLSRVSNWAQELSLGEQQRLSFARVVFAEPNFCFMDEATSSLDPKSEREMYELIATICVGGYVSIGHRKSIEAHHHRKLCLKGGGEPWAFEF